MDIREKEFEKKIKGKSEDGEKRGIRKEYKELGERKPKKKIFPDD